MKQIPSNDMTNQPTLPGMPEDARATPLRDAAPDRTFSQQAMNLLARRLAGEDDETESETDPFAAWEAHRTASVEAHETFIEKLSR